MTLEKRNNTKRAVVTDYIFIGGLLVMFALLTFFFYRQTIKYNGKYLSDTFAYAHNSGDMIEIRLIAFVFSKLGKIAGDTFGMALFMAAVIVATVFANYFFIKYLFERENLIVDRWKIQALSLIAIYSGPIYVPGVCECFYYHTWPKYSWQSPTEQAMILFAVISTHLFLKLYDGYLERINIRQYIGFIIACFCSAWAKPNFLLVFVPVFVIILVADFIRKKEYSLWHRFKRVFLMGITMLPAGIFTLILSSLEYSPDSNGGIAIKIGYFLRACENVPAMIFLALAFTLIVILFNLKKLKDIAYQVMVGMLVFGVGEYLILVESGKTINHGNFGWGREVGEYILFIGAMVLAVSNYRNKDFLADKPILRKIYFLALILFMTGHVLSQLVYMVHILRGNLYRI